MFNFYYHMKKAQTKYYSGLETKSFVSNDAAENTRQMNADKLFKSPHKLVACKTNYP